MKYVDASGCVFLWILALANEAAGIFESAYEGNEIIKSKKKIIL